jgi:malate synthase
MAVTLPQGVEILAPLTPAFEEILTTEALAFVAKLHRQFEARRRELIAARVVRQAELDAGKLPDFLPETAAIRAGDWKIAPLPQDLLDRRVEITGPVDRKMMINALNSGAKSFMADFEDSNCPSWENQISGQINVRDAYRKTISFANPDGKQYKLNDTIATLILRPRGWHLMEKHVTVDGEIVSGSLFDFALSFFHNIAYLQSVGSATYYYLPKMEGHLEARLWNDVFVFAQKELGIAARHHQGHRTDRNHPRRLRDGRNPLRTARAQLRPERRSLGLHLQLHQEVQAEPRLLPGQPLRSP